MLWDVLCKFILADIDGALPDHIKFNMFTCEQCTYGSRFNIAKDVFYHTISQNVETTRRFVKIFISLWNSIATFRQCCWVACQIIQRFENPIQWFDPSETLQYLTIQCFMWYPNGPDCHHVTVTISTSSTANTLSHNSIFKFSSVHLPNWVDVGKRLAFT